MSDHEEQKNIEWAKAEPMIKALNDKGVSSFFGEIKGFKDAFVGNNHAHAVCMDEGTAFIPMENGKLCVAGSGILFPANSEEERLSKVAQLYLDNGVREITSHEGCGAAKLAFLHDHGDADPHDISAETINNYAQEWVEKLTAEMNNKTNGKVESRNIGSKEMPRPESFHNAVVVYYDGTGLFDPAGKGLPMGFVINRKIDGRDYALAELGVAIDIAFGGHGFGDRFTHDLPFTVIVMGADSQVLELKKEVEDALLNNKYKDRIKIDSLVAG